MLVYWQRVAIFTLGCADVEYSAAIPQSYLVYLMITWIIAAVVVIVLLYGVVVFNELTKEKILVEEGWSGIGTFLQQRNDLIPNMVEAVKGYAGHENKTLADVIKWRNQSVAASTPAEQSQAEAGLGRAMIDVLSLTEQYPELKASKNFLRLQRSLGEMEEKINQSRRYYNGTVREFNQSIAVFPKNIVASAFGFRSFEFFKEDEAAGVAPSVRFS